MENKIIEALKASNGHLTRHRLMKRLYGANASSKDWQTYLSAEQALVDNRAIERRRGRHGGIYLPPTGAKTSVVETAEQKRERKHYEPALGVILQNWREYFSCQSIFVAKVADQGARRTGGRWTQPDLIVCTVSEWVFSARPEGEVTTVEIKQYRDLNVLAVYEALSHKSCAHYSYLLVVDVPEEYGDEEQAAFDHVMAVADQHGIGLITAGDTSDWNSWYFYLDAKRSNSNHQAIHDFLMAQFPIKEREAFRLNLQSTHGRVAKPANNASES